MHTLIKPTTKFLTGLIPANWTELIFEYKNFYMIYVSGDENATEEEWENYRLKVEEEFGDNIDKIYQRPEEKIVFEIYLKKNDEFLN